MKKAVKQRLVTKAEVRHKANAAAAKAKKRQVRNERPKNANLGSTTMAPAVVANAAGKITKRNLAAKANSARNSSNDVNGIPLAPPRKAAKKLSQLPALDYNADKRIWLGIYDSKLMPDLGDSPTWLALEVK